jgi:hypothetical protein
MKSRNLLLVSCLFLTTTLTCVFMALRPPEAGVRIPVHAANGKMGYIDGCGKMVIDADWDTATPFGPDDNARVSVKQEVTKTRMLLSRWFPTLWRFGMARTGYYRIDRFGNTTTEAPPVPYLLDSAISPPDSDGMTLVEQGSGFRWILKDGSSALPGSWQKVLDFKDDDPAAVFKDGRWGFINRNGESVIPFRWDETHGFDGNGRACVAIDRKWGVIDREGRLVVPLYFKSLAGFDDKNMCSAQLASGCGFINREGKILIPFRYRKAGSFDRFDMAEIEIANSQGAVRRGWITRRGEFVVQPIYHLDDPVWASNFTDHELLPVIGSNGPGLIDRKGATVVAAASGELQHIGDPTAPGKFWIRTAPRRSVTPPPGSLRPPFEPACYDQTGKLIWRDDILASSRIFTICAAISGLIAAALFAMGLLHRSKREIPGSG